MSGTPKKRRPMKRRVPKVRQPGLQHPAIERQRHDDHVRVKRTYMIRADYAQKIDQLVLADIYLNKGDVIETALAKLIAHHWPGQGWEQR